MTRDEFKGLRGQSFGSKRVQGEPMSWPAWWFAVGVVCAAVIVLVLGMRRARGQELDPITATFGPPTAAAKQADPVRQARVDLGRMLYNDRRVGDGTTSCADCHRLDRGTSDGRVKAVGRIGSPGFPNGRVGPRHTPPTLNVGFRLDKSMFWDGRARDLVEQALGPIANPDEMANQTPQQMCNRLNRIAGYRTLAQAAFGSPDLTPNRFAVAVSQFQADVLKATDTPLSRYLGGDDLAELSEEARLGVPLYQKHCAVCHPAPTFTNGQAANNGFETLSDTGDLGLEKTTSNRAHRRQFKPPSLVGVAQRAPYGHNGALASLERIVLHYGSGGSFRVDGKDVKDRLIDPRVAKIHMNADEQRYLLALMKEGFVAYDYPTADKVVPKELPR